MNRRIVAYGSVWYAGAPKGPDFLDRWKGFGGQKFLIRFNDGREIETDDLVWQCNAHEYEIDNALIFFPATGEECKGGLFK